MSLHEVSVEPSGLSVIRTRDRNDVEAQSVNAFETHSAMRPLGGLPAAAEDHLPSEKLKEETSSVNALSISTLTKVLEQQIGLLKSMDSLLKSMNERQAAAETSMKPIPQLPAGSARAWMALWQSFKDQVNPQVDRLKGSMDALLVFIGLFSAIITAFLVDSAKNLKPDEAARTNILLLNLTDVVLAAHGIQFKNLSLPYEETFAPAATDVRPNAYWFISLVISLLLAAVAVVCRGVLMSILETKTRSPSESLTEVRKRWIDAGRLLKPVVEGIPHIMVLPVVLFIIGLLDTLFNYNSRLPRNSGGIVAAFALSLVFSISIVLALIIFYFHDTLLTAIRALWFSVVIALNAIAKMLGFIRDFGDSLALALNPPHIGEDGPPIMNARRTLSRPADTTIDIIPSLDQASVSWEEQVKTYGSLLRDARDDELLEEGSTIVKEMVLINAKKINEDALNGVDLLNRLLSPEASMRSSVTVLELMTSEDVNARFLRRLSISDKERLLRSTISLAWRILIVKGATSLLESQAFHAVCALCRPIEGIRGSKMPHIFCLMWIDPTIIDYDTRSELLALAAAALSNIPQQSKGDYDQAVKRIWLSSAGDSFSVFSDLTPNSMSDSSFAKKADLIMSTFANIFITCYKRNREGFHRRRFMKGHLRLIFEASGQDKLIHLLRLVLKPVGPTTELDGTCVLLKTLCSEVISRTQDSTELLFTFNALQTSISVIRDMNRRRSTFLDFDSDPLRARCYLRYTSQLLKLTRAYIEHEKGNMPDSIATQEETIQFIFLTDYGLEELNKPEWHTEARNRKSLTQAEHHLHELIGTCLSIWPEMPVPKRSLEESVKARYYPLPLEWERRYLDEKVLFVCLDARRTPKEFPGFTVAPREMSPSDVVLPEDDGYWDESMRERQFSNYEGSAENILHFL